MVAHTTKIPRSPQTTAALSAQRQRVRCAGGADDDRFDPARLSPGTPADPSISSRRSIAETAATAVARPAASKGSSHRVVLTGQGVSELLCGALSCQRSSDRAIASTSAPSSCLRLLRRRLDGRIEPGSAAGFHRRRESRDWRNPGKLRASGGVGVFPQMSAEREHARAPACGKAGAPAAARRSTSRRRGQPRDWRGAGKRSDRP